MPVADPLAVIAGRPDVAAAASAARDAVDGVLWRRDVRAEAGAVAAASLDRGARDSAAIDGADIVDVDESPMGRVLASAMRLAIEVPRQVEVFAAAPLQALAALHAVVAAGMEPDGRLGRPRVGDAADDPLRLGPPPGARAVADRLVLLADTLTVPTSAPAVVVAAIAHAELAALRPFSYGSGLVARATVRLVLAGRGVDPSMFTIPEHGMLALGRPAYVAAVRAYMTGTADGVASFVVWQATAIAAGAAAVIVP